MLKRITRNANSVQASTLIFRCHSGSPARRESQENVITLPLFDERLLNCRQLPLQSPDTVQEPLLVLDRVSHMGDTDIPTGVYNL